jgi:hypothetical protein
MGTILVPLLAHYPRPPAPVQAAAAGGLPKDGRKQVIGKVLIADRPQKAIDRQSANRG